MLELALVMLAGWSTVEISRAGDILRPGGATANSATAPAASSIGSLTPAQLAARSQDPLSRTTMALQSVQAMQAAAHQAAIQGANNLGADPNHPGQTLPNVPDGIAVGGLNPGVSGVDPVASSTSTTAGTTTSTYDRPASWIGVGTSTSSGLTQQTSTGSAQTTVTITQTSQDALLTWQTFNIGKNTTLDFDQSAGGANAGSWIAFNLIKDPSGVPSQILGSINAIGQVYVINQNGIIFGGSSQVNMGALVAASLPINGNLSDPTTGRGLLNNPDDQFLFSQLTVPAGTEGPTPAFTPPASPLAVTQNGTTLNHDGDVTVQAGAQITSPSTDGVGGKVALIGPNVTNDGAISTPDGQTILAAGLQIAFAAHASDDATLRGLDVYVGAVTDSTYSGAAGTVTNNGLIDSPRADITLAGSSVNQLGFINSSTSVVRNGRVDLLADYDTIVAAPTSDPTALQFSPTATGTITLGDGSVTQILPEVSSTDTVVGSELALPSVVNFQGQTISMEGDALLVAPGANISSGQTVTSYGAALTSGITVDAGNWYYLNGLYSFAYTGGSISVAPGAEIDAAGSADVSASVSEDIVAAQLLGTQLEDAPALRDSVLRGQTVDFNILQSGVNADGSTWVGTPLFDTSGYVSLIQHTVGELTANGGTVALNAGGNVNLQAGSTVDVSGGSINYAGAEVQTTQLISNGTIYGIAQATSDLTYTGIYQGGFTTSYTKYGLNQTTASPMNGGNYYQTGYIQGGNGGSLTISAPNVSAQGTLLGSTVAGAIQVSNQAPIPSKFDLLGQGPSALPTLGSLSIDFTGQYLAGNGAFSYSPSPTDVVFQPVGTTAVANPFAGSGNPELDLPADIVGNGNFGNLTIIDNDNYFGANSVNGVTTGAGNIALPAGVALNLPAGGSLNLSAANITIDGTISAPGGSIALAADDASPLLVLNILGAPPADPTRGNFILGADASLSTAGLYVDNRASSATAGTIPTVIKGGSISVAGYNVTLSAGSLIDASGGASASPTAAITYGAGGNIAVLAGDDPLLNSIVGGELNMAGSVLQAYSGGAGGTLTLQDSQVQIGGDALVDGGTLADTLWINPQGTDGQLLTPDFFDQGGFANFTLTGLGEVGGPTGYEPALVVATGAVIAPVVQSEAVTLTPTGMAVQETTLPAYLQGASVLNLNAPGITDPNSGTTVLRGDLVMQAGSSITLNPNAASAVNLDGDTVSIGGEVTVSGGNIGVAGASKSVGLFSTTGDVAPTVILDSGSLLSTAGSTVQSFNSLGYHTGTVLNGGTITVSGNIAALSGATLNVSGATDLLDLAPTYSGGTLSVGPSNLALVPVRVDSNGGSITLTGGQQLYTAATLLGYAGGIGPQGGTSSAQGGSLTISSGIFLQSGAIKSPLDYSLLVTQDIPQIGAIIFGEPLTDVNGQELPDMGYFGADSFSTADGHSAGGLDSIVLSGSVDFSGAVTLTANRAIQVGSGGVIAADAPVLLDAPYVEVGTSFAAPISQIDPTPSIFTQGSEPFYLLPTPGAGTLTVNADLVDIGSLSLQGIATANLTANDGDIRGDGTFDIAGALTLTSAQIYPITETNFTVTAYDYTTGTGGNAVSHAGSVTLVQSGAIPAVPLSADGQLNIYASTIVQDGTARAPFGAINLGYDGSGPSPEDFLTGAGTGAIGAVATSVPVAEQVTLGAGSVTSVSSDGATIPFGQDLNGSDYVDPIGQEITASGVLVAKAVHISGATVNDQAGSEIDLSGGGDLLAYQFIAGTGGSTDILGSTSSYAILPGVQTSAAPIDPLYDTGYTSANLPVGAQVYLNGSPGLPAGYYTLLPARYALLPGAFLVTKETTSAIPPSGAVTMPDGAVLVGGYVSNGLDQTHSGTGVESTYEIDSSSVIQSRADYGQFTAGSYLTSQAAAQNTAVPRLPSDAGQLILLATQALNINGSLDATVTGNEKGAEVDIASGSGDDIAIVGSGVADPGALYAGDLILNASTLNQFGAASLVVGGYRTEVNGVTTLNVTTDDLTVDDAGSPLMVADLTLAASNNLTVANGSVIAPTGATPGGTAEPLTVQGNGALLRVSGDASATITRTGQDFSTSPTLTIGDNVQLGAAIPTGSVILDSSNQMVLAPTVQLSAQAITIDSGAISLNLAGLAAGQLQPSPGLVISNSVLAGLQGSAQSLSLLSYSTLDIYGAGTIGTADSTLALHAGSVRSFDLGSGQVTLQGSSVLIDNSSGAAVSTAAPNSSGTLNIQTGKLTIGASSLALAGSWSDASYNITGVTQAGSLYVGEAVTGAGIQAGTTIQSIQGTTVSLSAETTAAGSNVAVPSAVNVSGFNQVQIASTGGVQGQGTGGLAVVGNLEIATPSITGAAGSDQSISATGTLDLEPLAGATSTLTGGLGASLTLTGASILANTNISLPSGTVDLVSLTGDLSVGGVIDVSGAAQTFNDVTKYTNGGQIDLTASQGNVILAAGSEVNVSAATGGTANAGTLSIGAADGTLELSPTAVLSGQGGTGGQGGNFVLDVDHYNNGSGTSELAPLEAALTPPTTTGGNVVGGFTHSQQIRIRSGDVDLNGTAAAATYDLSADVGSITLGANGKIIATQEANGQIDTTTATANGITQLTNPGATGGEADLEAGGSLTLDGGSLITVEGQNMNNAGRGGAITLEAGDETDANASLFQNQIYTGTAALTIAANATLDLSVVNGPTANRPDEKAGSLLLRAPQILNGNGQTVVAVNPIAGTIVGAASVTVEGYKVYDLTGTSGIIDNEEAAVEANGTTFANTMGDPHVAGSLAAALFSQTVFIGAAPTLTVEPGAEIVNRTGNLTLDTSWDLSTDRFGPDNVAGDLTLRAAGNLVFEDKASLSDGFTPVAPYGLWDATLMPVGATSWSYRLVAGADFGAANFRDVVPLPTVGGVGTGSLLLGEGSPELSTNQNNSRSSIIPNFFQTIRTGTGTISIYAGRDVQLLNPLATIYTAGTQAAAVAGYTAPNVNYSASAQLGAKQTPIYPVLFSEDGGNLVISAQGNIEDLVANSNGQLVQDSSLELPSNWLYRAGNGGSTPTSWWTDFSNFFEGVGALGGGNVTLTAGNDIANVDAVIPTNAREGTGGTLTELGGGDLVITTGNNLNGGVYYVERGDATLTIGGDVQTNPTRAALTEDEIDNDNANGIVPDVSNWLPTSFFLGQGSIDLTANGSVQVGSVTNPFLLPGGLNNGYSNKSYFLTYSSTDAVDISSLNGAITLKDAPDGGADAAGSLTSWYQNVLLYYQNPLSFSAISEPWLRLDETNVGTFGTVAGIMPATLEATAFSGDLNIVGELELDPSATGTLDLLAAGAINGIEVNGFTGTNDIFASAVINLSDAPPSALPAVLAPLFSSTSATNPDVLDSVDDLFNESGSTEGTYAVLQTQMELHDPGPLHAADPTPVHIYAEDGSISGVTLYSAKLARVVAGQDITDVALYIQNDNPTDVSVVAAGGNIIAYDPGSPLRQLAQENGNELLIPSTGTSIPGTGTPTAGDIQISGPGTLEVLAGQNLSLGVGTEFSDGTGAGITSVGAQRNPALASIVAQDGGAQIIAAGGIGPIAGLEESSLDFTDAQGTGFIDQFLNPGAVESAIYLPDLGNLLGLSGDSPAQVWTFFNALPVANQDADALTIFYDVLRDSGRNHTTGTGSGYASGTQAIQALFPNAQNDTGDISLTSREIKTEDGGDIDVFDPAGQITVGYDLSSGQPVDQGVLTVDGGNISMYAEGNVNVGTSRIFTLHGGNVIIYSATGNIAAGASSKTVQSASPTRVVVDPQSADVQADLAGLATGGGIGVLETIPGAPPADVDLVAPAGFVDAGDAGIRASGNLNIAAVQVLNAGNISAGGKTSGVPTVSAPNIAGLGSASSATAAAANASNETTRNAEQNASQQPTDLPSIITVEVLGYGGGDSDN
jgi:filamentous hemagglutinin